MDIYQIATIALTPITGVVTWFAARHKRTNDTISALQAQIDECIKRNNSLVSEIISLRGKIIELEEANKRWEQQCKHLEEKINSINNK